MIDIDKELMAYFRELSPTERRDMLKKMTDEGSLDSETQELCQRLYDERYRDEKHPDKLIDRWIFKLVYLPGMFRKSRFFKGGIKREKEALLKDLHLSNPEALSEAEATILYWEYRNAAKRYLSTCDSPDYANSFFGLKKSGPEDKKLKACEDIWMASEGFANMVGEEERLGLWCEALYDELLQYDQSLKTAFAEMKHKRL